jgi:hypothetical protein
MCDVTIEILVKYSKLMKVIGTLFLVMTFGEMALIVPTIRSRRDYLYLVFTFLGLYLPLYLRVIVPTIRSRWDYLYLVFTFLGLLLTSISTCNCTNNWVMEGLSIFSIYLFRARYLPL